jgi:plasmid maintenance system antidote protein VapI
MWLGLQNLYDIYKTYKNKKEFELFVSIPIRAQKLAFA